MAQQAYDRESDQVSKIEAKATDEVYKSAGQAEGRQSARRPRARGEREPPECRLQL